MEAIARLMRRHQQDLQPDDPPPALRTEMDEDSWTVWMEGKVPLYAHRWKRLVIIMDIVNTHALTGSLLTYLEQARELKATEALNLYKKLAGKTQIATNTQKVRWKFSDAPKPMAKGRPLPRSRIPSAADPLTCPHNPEDMSGPRGSGSKEGPLYWVTCRKCGSRWERIWEDLVPRSVPPLARPSTAPTMVPTIPEEEFTELFSETDSDHQFVQVPPRGRMVAAEFQRRPEPPPTPTAIESWMASQAILPASVALALTTPTPETMETPTPAMTACHAAIQARVQSGMTVMAAIDHAWASCTNDEELGAIKAYLLANPTLHLSP
jgi:hypothetical protein